MQIVIDIPKEIYKLCVTNDYFFCNETDTIRQAIKNGTPLDKIRAEIDRQEKWLLQAGYTAYNVDIAFDAIKVVLAESEDRE